MASSRPIISRPFVSGDETSSLRAVDGARAPRGEASSRRSSVSRPSSRESKPRARSASRQSQASSRGRKGYQFSEEVDRGLVRIVDSTDVSFDTLAQAVEEVGGPRKLWLRRRFEQIAGTKSFGFLRLRNHRPSAEDRKERQLMAKELADELGLNVDDEGEVQASRELDNGYHRRFSTPNWNLDQAIRRKSTISTASASKIVPNGRPVQSQDRDTTQSWTGPTSAISNSTSNTPTDYVAKGNRARALSISSITRQLENLTGNTGFYEFIQRRGSNKSHLSPLFRLSRGSRATSGRTSYPLSGFHDQTSPTDRAAVVYVPDPDFQDIYNIPSPGLLSSTEAKGATAVLILLQVKVAANTDVQANTRLFHALPIRVEDRKTWVDQADENGVTALHLAVAYGYPTACALLIHNGANFRATTHRGSSICRFAKPAQELAGADISLFHRILNSRQWVCAGLPPRLAADAVPEEKPSTTSKRTRTGDAVPTLSTVDEHAVNEPQPEAAPQRGSFQEHSVPVTNSNHGLAPLFTSWDFLRDGIPPSNLRNSLSNQLSYDYNEPPSCLHDHSTIADLLTPESTTRSAMSWSMDTSSPGSQFRTASSSHAVMPPQQTSALFPNQVHGSGSASFDGLTLTTSPEQDASTGTSSLWPNLYSASLGFPTAPAVAPQSINQGRHFVSSDVQQYSTHLPIAVPPFTPNHPVPSNYNMDTAHYQLSSAQHPQYQPPITQALYPTPPQETGWPTMRHSQPTAQDWMDWSVPQATNRALLAQDFTTFPESMWHSTTSAETLDALMRMDSSMPANTTAPHHTGYDNGGYGDSRRERTAR